MIVESVEKVSPGPPRLLSLGGAAVGGLVNDITIIVNHIIINVIIMMVIILIHNIMIFTIIAIIMIFAAILMIIAIIAS